MRLALFSALACVAALALAGCVPSLHPVCTDRTAILDDRIVGFWEGTDGDCVGFQRLSANRYYELVVPPGNARKPPSEREDNYEIRLIKLGQSLYMDLFPKDRETVVDDPPAHVFVRIWLRQDELHMSLMDPSYFANLIKQKKIIVKHKTLEDGDILLTAGTAELQKLLVRLDSDPKAFQEPRVYKRRSTGPCPE